MIIKLRIFCIIGLAASCSNDREIESYLINVKKLNKAIPIDGWKLVRQYDNDQGKGYDLTREFSGENSRLCFHINEKSKEYFIEYYIKSYRDSFNEYTLEINQTDTLYLYRSPLNNQNSKVFMVGEYQYLYMHNKFSEGQREYFRANSDSLRRVRGNNLPILPSIDLSYQRKNDPN